MSIEIGHGSFLRRIAIHTGAGFVPGMNAVVMGAALAAGKLGWELVGIRDGFDGVLHPERYPDGGLVSLSPQRIENLDPAAAGLLGQSARVDPFHVRQIDEDEMVQEVDMSDELLNRLRAEGIDGLISIVGGRGLSILYKLHRKGLNSVCVPRSIENDIAATMVSFGFNSALSFTIEMLDKARQAAQSARKIAVVEVLGEQAGWIALQAGIAVCADAVLIPEVPCDLRTVAARLKDKITPRRPYGLVVVAEGATLVESSSAQTQPSALKASLSPLATGDASDHVIQRSGQAAENVARELQLLIAEETFPLVLGPWVRGGVPTAVDRQLGLCYGAGAVRRRESRQVWGDGGFSAARHQVRATGGSDQQGQNGARGQRIHPDRPLTGHLPGEGTVMNQPNNPSALTGTVLNIQRYCSHDGPGIRTTVFLKGCSLRCKWCGNPESIARKPELSYDSKKCTGKKECGVCLKSPFPEGAFYVVEGGADDKVKVNWHLAMDCDEALASLCPTGALEIFGKSMTVDEVLDEVEKDASFYRNTGGGITLSGGECLLQPDFSAALLAGAHQRGFNTAIETACNVPWRFVEQVLPHVDTMLHDHKLTIPERHKKWVGVDNKRVLENFKKAYETFPNIDFIARTPLIPGINADEEHIRAVLAFIRPHKNVIDYELLPYHRFGLGKYELLGEVYELDDYKTPSDDLVKHLQAIIDEAFGRTGGAK